MTHSFLSLISIEGNVLELCSRCYPKVKQKFEREID